MNRGQAGRKRLLHEVPQFVSKNPEGEVFFITICCEPRKRNQLATDSAWSALKDTFEHRENKGDLKIILLLAMPDHLHALLAFNSGRPMPRVITSIKSWLAKTAGIDWQDQFFDHRLRSTESAAEKGAYIRLNPVRAGLVNEPDDWPYCIDRVKDQHS